MNNGWVKLWRDQFTHEISERKPWCDGYAWSYLYSRANFRPAIVNFRNQYIPVERGQFVTSELKLSKIFGWSRRRTNSFLNALERGGMCDNKRTQRFIIIGICNYDKFQSTENENETTDVTTDVTTGGQQVHIDKNDKNIKPFLSNSDEVRLSELLLEKILSRNPNHKKPNIQTWAKSIDSMIRIDHRTPEEIRAVIKWSQADTFWQNNILSAAKLRDKFDQLCLKMGTEGKSDSGKPWFPGGGHE